MQKVILGVIFIAILSLIGCSGLVGQGTGNEELNNTTQIQADLVEALGKVVKLIEESEQLRSEIDKLNQQADEVKVDFEVEINKVLKEDREKFESEINKIIEEIDQGWQIRIENERSEIENSYQSIINQIENDRSELEDRYQNEINDLIKRSDDSNRKTDDARKRLEEALSTIQDLNKESLRLQGELSKALNKIDEWSSQGQTFSNSNTLPPVTSSLPPFLTNISNNNSTEGYPDWSPDGTKIVFSSDQHLTNDLDIYVMNTDGSNRVQLTNNVGIDDYPDWSPDGTRIVFSSAQNDPNGVKRNIYVINADGSNQVRLTFEGNVAHPKWSPNGNKITFQMSLESSSLYQIYVMNVDGSNLIRLTEPGIDSNVPVWSVDGKKIIFDSYRNSNWDVYVIDENGSNLTQLTSNNSQDAEPSITTDGKIAFLSDRSNTSGLFDIYLINMDGSNLIKYLSLSTDYGLMLNPDNSDWSQDGKNLVFASDNSSASSLNYQIYVMNIN